MPRKNYFVHSSSCVDKGAKIGKGTKIWHYSHIMPRARIGENCKIGQNVHIANNVVIGNNVKIQNNVSIYEGVELQDDVFCGPSMVFTNILVPRSAFPRNTPDLYEKTVVKKGTSIGANATIICGITIGPHGFIGAGSVVTKNVPTHGLVYGNPASLRGWACRCGGKLKKNKKGWSCALCKMAYKIKEQKVTVFREEGATLTGKVRC